MNAKQRRQQYRRNLKFALEITDSFSDALRDIDAGKITARELLDQFDEFRRYVVAAKPSTNFTDDQRRTARGDS